MSAARGRVSVMIAINALLLILAAPVIILAKLLKMQ